MLKHLTIQLSYLVHLAQAIKEKMYLTKIPHRLHYMYIC